MADRPTEPIREQHRRLTADVEIWELVAAAAGVAPPGLVVAGVDAALALLTEQVLPVARAEERILYAAVRGTTVDDALIAEMCSDHDLLAELTVVLADLRRDLTGTIDEATAEGVRTVLGRLATVLLTHLARERLAVLDAIDERQADGAALVERLAAAVGGR